MLELIISRIMSEDGQGLVEYSLIIFLVAVVLVASLTALAAGIGGVFNAAIAAL